MASSGDGNGRNGSVAVQLLGISKYFPGVVANEDVDLELRRGEVHALLGENGAGKSTLMNVLSGIYHPDAGQILVDGEGVAFRSPADAIASGIGMVHQHFRLVPAFTVAENIHLGWTETPWRVSTDVLRRRTETLEKRYGLKLRPDARVEQLSAGEQQRVEILRVLSRGARILILDEPTAVLTPGEARELFAALRQLAADGHTIIFISHKLEEVLEVADRISVLRGGRRVATHEAEDCNRRMLANLMVGKDVEFGNYRRVETAAKPVLEVEKLNAPADHGGLALSDVDLVLYGSEILGVAGVAGNGQKELAEVLTGLRRARSGGIVIEGNRLENAGPLQFLNAGIGHIPEDRIRSAIAPGLSVAENAIVREYRQPPISSGWLLNLPASRRFAEALVQAANVKTPSVRTHVNNLSGGNQQKLVVRRETQKAARALIAAYPTRGLDVAAAEDVRRALMEQRNSGVAVLLISEDLDEILALSDRVAVMFEGRVMAVFQAGTADREAIGLLMGGVSDAQ